MPTFLIRTALFLVALTLTACSASESLSPTGATFSPTIGERAASTTPVTREKSDLPIKTFDVGSSNTKTPYNLFLGPDGAIWFTPNAPYFGILSPNGTVSSYPLPPATFPNANPDWFAIGPDHNIWFTDYYGGKLGTIVNGNVTEYDPFQGTLAGAYTSELVNGPGHHLSLILTSPSYSAIAAVSTQGKILKTELLPGTFCLQSVLSKGPNGTLWTGGNAHCPNITRMDSDWNIVTFAVPQLTQGLGGITLGPDGNMWFTGYKKVGRITMSGSVRMFRIASSAFNIVVGPDRNLWFTEPFVGIIGRVTMSGEVSEFHVPGTAVRESPEYQVNGIKTGRDGNIWFTEPAHNKLGVLYCNVPSSPCAPQKKS